MNIKKAETARKLLAEKEALEKAINCTLCEFDITVKVDASHPRRTWLEPYLRMFIKEELQSMMEERLSIVEKQLKRL